MWELDMMYESVLYIIDVILFIYVFMLNIFKFFLYIDIKVVVNKIV